MEKIEIWEFFTRFILLNSLKNRDFVCVLKFDFFEEKDKLDFRVYARFFTFVCHLMAIYIVYSN